MKEYKIGKKLEELAAKAHDQYVQSKIKELSKIPTGEFSKDDLKNLSDSFVSRYEKSLANFEPTKTTKIKLPIYSQIDLEPKLSYIYSMAYIQRMAYIKQLSFSYMAYPGALHSRLEHSLGVSYLIGEFCNHLQNSDRNLNDETILSAKVAGMLHDAGHGPCGHSLELIKSYISPKKGRGDYRKLDKLLICDELNNKSSAIRRALDSIEVDHEFIGQLLGCDEGINRQLIYLTDLFDSAVDADRIDYLARDSYHVGKASIENPLDYARSATICRYTDEKQKVYDRLSLAYTKDAIGDCIKIINARKNMYAEVYEQIDRVAADEMICHALYYLIDDFQLDKTQEGNLIIRNLLKLTDHELLFLLRVSGKEDIINLIESLLTTNLYSEICSFPLNSKEHPEIGKFASSILALGYYLKVKKEQEFWESIDNNIKGLIPQKEVLRPRIFIYVPTFVKDAEQTEREKRVINDTLICQDGGCAVPISTIPSAPTESLDPRTFNLRLFAPSILTKHKEKIKNDFIEFVAECVQESQATSK